MGFDFDPERRRGATVIYAQQGGFLVHLSE
jgi:hypothetical protein